MYGEVTHALLSELVAYSSWLAQKLCRLPPPHISSSRAGRAE